LGVLVWKLYHLATLMYIHQCSNLYWKRSYQSTTPTSLICLTSHSLHKGRLLRYIHTYMKETMDIHFFLSNCWFDIVQWNGWRECEI
jgi:hypothetical protein